MITISKPFPGVYCNGPCKMVTLISDDEETAVTVPRSRIAFLEEDGLTIEDVYYGELNKFLS